MNLRNPDAARTPPPSAVNGEGEVKRKTVTCAECERDVEAFVVHPAGTGRRLCLPCYNNLVAEKSD